MFFIKLTYLDDVPVWINMSHVVCYEPNEDNTTSIVTTFCSVNVKETVSEITRRLSQ